MDYVVGSVAALVSGNVTPNRPKFLKRALTPTKHQPSPNVTPKSEVVEDRSIFLSPTLQKKKAIVKKSPKRIFENPDLDVSNDGEGNTKSPKADKVKKHLNDELEADTGSLKSPKNKMSKIKESALKKSEWKIEEAEVNVESPQDQNENTPKKKKNQKADTENYDRTKEIENANKINDSNLGFTSPHIVKSKKKKNKMLNSSSRVEDEGDKSLKDDNEKENSISNRQKLAPVSPKKKNKLKAINKQSKNVEGQMENKDKENSSNNSLNNSLGGTSELLENIQSQIKNRKRKSKSKSKDNVAENIKLGTDQEEIKSNDEKISKKKKKGKKDIIINPNAITDKDTDSEHESDNEIESENEQNNQEVLDTGPAEESSDDEEKTPEKKESVTNNKEVVVETEEQIKRTLFVGNVSFSAKCKKEIKKIFSKYGQIETVRIRTVPVKDGRVTPKLAVIKNELHPDRSTVNVYVKFRDASSVKEALAENGTVLNDHHLRVTRSDSTGSEHDPKCSIFIGNLPFAMEDEALYQKFEKCGEIDSVRIVRDKKTNAGKGFGYVNFKTKDAVELALALPEEDLTIKNRIIRVKRCTQITHKQKAQQENRRGSQGNTGRNLHRNNPQGSYRGSFRGQGSYGRDNAQRNRGNMQGYSGRNNAQRNFSRENGQNQNGSKADGAFRRLMNKRRNQEDGTDGPQNKRQRNMNNPGKKERKEFVGMTAEKKKKHKIAKGQKKKKVLSEILTKQ